MGRYYPSKEEEKELIEDFKEHGSPMTEEKIQEIIDDMNFMNGSIEWTEEQKQDYIDINRENGEYMENENITLSYFNIKL